MDRIAIIDGNSLINRAYFAMRNPMLTKDGIYTQGIFGFINMLNKIRSDYEPTHMLIAFDMKAPTFRHKQYDAYKAGRKGMPPELAMQIPLLKDILDAMNISRMEIEGYEADDIIGTMAKKAEAEGLEPYIITGDKDELQLASDTTKVIFTKKGVSEFDIYDKNAMIEKYGFGPDLFIDLKGLMGDQSDNIPGVPGVGEKTATKLILEFGSVENIIEHVDDIKPAGVQKKIAENATLAMMSKRLATIFTEVPLDITVEDCLLQEPDYEKLLALYKKLEFNKFISQLDIPEGSEISAVVEDSTVESFSAENLKQTVIKNADDLKNVHLEGDTVIKVFGDYNHLFKPQIDGIALMSDTEYVYIDCSQVEPYEWLDKQDITLIGHDLKQDYFMLMHYGVTVFNSAFDTAVAQYVLDSSRNKYDISTLSTEYLGKTIAEFSDYMADNGQIDLFTDTSKQYSDYGISYCETVKNIMLHQQSELKKQSLESVLYDIELPLVEVMAAMEKEGFKADKDYLTEFGKVLSEEIDKLQSQVYELAGEEFNINSPKQLGSILFEKLELPAGKKTKTGYSTNAEVLEKIADKHPIVPAVQEYRTLSKLKSTYVDGLVPLINKEDDKIHAHFMQTVTTTGRISCVEPNLQNIPIRQELGRKLRKAFVPETDECLLVGADYSQIELRVLAHMANDSVLIDAFNKGEDIHRATASNVLGIPEDEITPMERSRAKAVNFGVIYGMSSFGLSTELNITRKDADNYIKAYFEKHKAVKEFMDNSIEFCKENGYITTMLGRKRYVKEINASAYMVRQIGERLAMNTPIQGSAADIIKLAMVKVYNAIKSEGLKSKLILQIHDELIINTYPDELERVKQLLVENMESAYKLAVELKAELNVGSNWYDLK